MINKVIIESRWISSLNSSNLAVCLNIFIIKCLGEKCPSVSTTRPTPLFFHDNSCFVQWRTFNPPVLVAAYSLLVSHRMSTAQYLKVHEIQCVCSNDVETGAKVLQLERDQPGSDSHSSASFPPSTLPPLGGHVTKGRSHCCVSACKVSGIFRHCQIRVLI